MVERIIPTRASLEEEPPGNGLRYLIYGLAFLIIAAAGGAITYAVLLEGQKFSAIYERLGIEPLPKNIENMPYIKADLAKLYDGPCDKFNVESLASSLDTISQAGLAAQVRQGYRSRCNTAAPVTSPEALLNHLATNGNVPDIRRLARQLQPNICNQPSLFSLLGHLQTNRDTRSQAALGDAYLARCGIDDDIAYNVMIAHFNLGEFDKSLAMATANDRIRPSTVYWPAWIGKSLMRLGRPSEAGDAFLVSLSRWNNPSNVDYIEFWNASDALRAAGRYCEAMKPLEQYVSYNPVKRLAPNVQGQLTSFAKLGNCPL